MINKIIAYAMNNRTPHIVPASVERGWMDNTPQKYAYRCLPLNMGNALGWQVISDTGFDVLWNGGPNKDDITITQTDGDGGTLPFSHFGANVITFHVNALFRTDPGVSLLVTGPFNQFVDGMFPLTGVVETEWLSSTFTMNWRITVPNVPLHFPRGFPICQLVPLDLNLVENHEAELRNIDDDPETKARYDQWARNRDQFLASGSPGWQRDYFTGKHVSGEKAPVHRTRIRMTNFEDKRKS